LAELNFRAHSVCDSATPIKEIDFVDASSLSIAHFGQCDVGWFVWAEINEDETHPTNH
jgi:hypothetical protein